MPTHKQCAKRQRQDVKRRARNQHYKTRLKHVIRQVRDNLDSGNVEAAAAALPTAVSELARIAGKGVIPKRRASRRISRLVKAVSAAKG